MQVWVQVQRCQKPLSPRSRPELGKIWPFPAIFPIDFFVECGGIFIIFFMRTHRLDSNVEVYPIASPRVGPLSKLNPPPPDVPEFAPSPTTVLAVSCLSILLVCCNFL